MSNATNALESAIGSALFLSQPLVTPTQWTVHLYAVAPNEDGTGGTEITAGANGYQPVRHDPGADRWVKVGTQDGSGNTLFRNSVNVTFPTAISAWGNVYAFGLKDQTGTLQFVAPLTTSKTIAIGDAPVFLAGELEIAIG